MDSRRSRSMVQGGGPGNPLSRLRALLARSWGLVLGLAAAMLVRWPLLGTKYVPFNSDEAVVGLMARHILEGTRPVFFYGQAYMGSLDAWLISAGFRLLGEEVLAIRIVQLALYFSFLVALWFLIRQLTGRTETANWGVLLAALPPLLVLTYTTATLGGYGEILLLEVVILLLAAKTLTQDKPSLPLYGLLGLLGGLAFWTLGLASVYLAPVGVVHLVRFRRDRIPGYILALLGFLVGSSPWWLYNWQHSGAALQVLSSNRPMDSTVGQRALGLLALGIPALLGLRAPWEPTFAPLPLAFTGVVLYLSVAAFLWARVRRWRDLTTGAWLLLGVVITFAVTFIATQFGIDATGRYLLPLYPVLIVGVAAFVTGARRWRTWAAPAILLIVWFLNGSMILRAAADSSRITTQFDPITRFGNEHDQELISFLESEDLNRGYSNHWVAYRLAFLTDEQIILAAELPYKEDLRYTPRDQRIPSYSAEVEEAERVVYVTTKHPELNRILRSEFDAHGAGYREREIGPYHVFYDLTPALRPEQLDLTAGILAP